MKRLFLALSAFALVLSMVSDTDAFFTPAGITGQTVEKTNYFDSTPDGISTRTDVAGSCYLRYMTFGTSQYSMTSYYNQSFGQDIFNYTLCYDSGSPISFEKIPGWNVSGVYLAHSSKPTKYGTLAHFYALVSIRSGSLVVVPYTVSTLPQFAYIKDGQYRSYRFAPDGTADILSWNINDGTYVIVQPGVVFQNLSSDLYPNTVDPIHVGFCYQTSTDSSTDSFNNFTCFYRANNNKVYKWQPLKGILTGYETFGQQEIFSVLNISGSSYLIYAIDKTDNFVYVYTLNSDSINNSSSYLPAKLSLDFRGQFSYDHSYLPSVSGYSNPYVYFDFAGTKFVNSFNCSNPYLWIDSNPVLEKLVCVNAAGQSQTPPVVAGTIYVLGGSSSGMGSIILPSTGNAPVTKFPVNSDWVNQTWSSSGSLTPDCPMQDKVVEAYPWLNYFNIPGFTVPLIEWHFTGFDIFGAFKCPLGYWFQLRSILLDF